MRIGILLGTLLTLLGLSCTASKEGSSAYDVVVYGGTSAGIAAAVQAHRMGKTVIVISPDQHLGGLTAGGLGWTDSGRKEAVGGFAREFYRRIKAHYDNPDVWTFQKPEDYSRFRPDDEAQADELRTIMAAARKVLADEIPARLRALEAEGDEGFALDPSGRLLWQSMPVARIAAGSAPLQPRIEVLASEFLDGRQRERIRRRLAPWLERHLRRKLWPLFRLAEAPLKGGARGLAFQIVEALGSLPRRAAKSQLAALSKAERRAFADLGVRLGAASLFLPALLRQRSIELRALLWAVQRGQPAPMAPRGPLVIERGSRRDGDEETEAFWLAVGYRRLQRGATAVSIRADAFERLAREARRLAGESPFAADAALLTQAGGDQAVLALLLAELGYRAEDTAEGPRFALRRGARKTPKRKPRPHRAAPDSPFALLQKLKKSP